MFKKNLGAVIFLLAISFIALVALQAYWIRSVVRLREDQFDATVNRILLDVSNNVENNLVCFELFSKVHFGSGDGIYLIKQKWDSIGNHERFIPAIYENHLIKNLDTITSYFHYEGKTDTLFPYNDVKFTHPATAEISMKFVYDQRKKAPLINKELIDSGKTKDYTAGQIQQLSYDSKPFKEKIDTLLLDSLLHHELRQKGISIKFSYAILDKGSGSVLFSKPAHPASALFTSDLKAGMFEKDHFTPPYELRIDFGNKSRYILSTITPVLIVSFIIILMLVLIFWFAVSTVLKEKRLTRMKTEFINNMTHEFKTPVSTIALAMETINSPEIINDKNKLNNFLTVMKEESNRLENQVERVLQISALEKNEFRMNLQPVQIIDLIYTTMKDFELYSKIKNASINMVYDGRHPVMTGDEAHIRNMLSNLIDNALKYSNGREPHITISSKQVNSDIIITVADNGIGMHHKELKKVFDKFYRIPTGDVHNIKGFGLGLSYVKTIVALHKGKIKAESEPGVGSKFTIHFQSSE